MAVDVTSEPRLVTDEDIKALKPGVYWAKKLLGMGGPVGTVLIVFSLAGVYFTVIAENERWIKAIPIPMYAYFAIMAVSLVVVLIWALTPDYSGRWIVSGKIIDFEVLVSYSSQSMRRHYRLGSKIEFFAGGARHTFGQGVIFNSFFGNGGVNFDGTVKGSEAYRSLESKLVGQTVAVVFRPDSPKDAECLGSAGDGFLFASFR